jgi:ribosomal protein L11 methyltransferase
MSFGTGHHATTTLMIRLMLDINFENYDALDMGCGTGLLAIMASQKKAKKIIAIDIDSWAYENTIENIERNKANNIIAKQGDASLLMNESFDIILANINRNILLSDMPIYVGCLKKDGILALSGFYSQDLPIILEKAQQIGLKYEKHIENDNWIAVKLIHSPN